MKERDYINATNLAKVRIAEHVVRDIHASSGEGAFEASLIDILNQLQKIRLDLERKTR